MDFLRILAMVIGIIVFIPVAGAIGIGIILAFTTGVINLSQGNAQEGVGLLLLGAVALSVAIYVIQRLPKNL